VESVAQPQSMAIFLCILLDVCAFWNIHFSEFLSPKRTALKRNCRAVHTDSAAHSGVFVSVAQFVT